jgi:hydroxyacylglutathione hydrolase
LEQIDFTGEAPENLDVSWIHGSLRRKTDPPIQVHEYNAHTYILRESKDLSYEAPFLYLLFGNDRAVLFDTGATANASKFPLRDTVDKIVTDWLAKNPRGNYELIVAHTHSHKDHLSGDPQFNNRPATEIVGKDLEAVKSFFGFKDWPQEVGHFDLGGRALELIPSPGHHATSISIYDSWTRFLITGDTIYPGRLYVFDYPAFQASLNRLTKFSETRKISYLLGCHIEMTKKAKIDYPVGTKFQPDEPPLQMEAAKLVEVRDAAEIASKRSGVYVQDDFIIYHLPCNRAIFKQLVRANLLNLRQSLGFSK